MQQAATNDFPATEASACHLGIEPVGKRIRVEFNGEIIADTSRAKMLHAARIEALTKETGTPIAISEKFNQCYPGPLPSIGLYKLRGVGEAREVFTLPVED